MSECSKSNSQWKSVQSAHKDGVVLYKLDSCISGGLSSHEGSSETSTGCLEDPGAKANVATLIDLGDCLNNGYLVLSNGRKVPFVSDACMEQHDGGQSRMTVARVGSAAVDVLRDTGCSGVIAKQQFVCPEQIHRKRWGDADGG